MPHSFACDRYTIQPFSTVAFAQLFYLQAGDTSNILNTYHPTAPFSTDRAVSQPGNTGHNAQLIAGNNAERTHFILQFTEKVPFLSCNCNHRHHLLPSGFSTHLCTRGLHIIVCLHFILLIYTISTSAPRKNVIRLGGILLFHSPIGRSILYFEA